eukprot:1143036-Pelagomonas_calceolata.AAC.5
MSRMQARPTIRSTVLCMAPMPARTASACAAWPLRVFMPALACPTARIGAAGGPAGGDPGSAAEPSQSGAHTGARHCGAAAGQPCPLLPGQAGVAQAGEAMLVEDEACAAAA